MGSRCARCSGFGFLLVTIAAAAQNTFPATGNVGIGTTAPGTPLQVVGTGNVVSIGEAANSSGHQLLFSVNNSGNGYSTIQSLYQGTAYTPLILNPNGGKVGIGTTAPTGLLDVNSIGGLVVSGANLDPNGSYSLVPLQNSGKLLEGWNISQGSGETDLISNRAGGSSGGFRFYDYSNSGVLTSLLTLLGSGNVGIGTTGPGAKLEVSGNVKLTAGSGASMTFQDGSVQTVAWNGVLAGGDYAESVDVSGDRAGYEAGDVLVIDPANEGRFLKSGQPYSTGVAGIYSTSPGVRGRRQKSDQTHMKDEVPMAMIGVVPTKVSAEGGSIHPGDILVTSSKSGYAMKGVDRTQIAGAIVGKALGHLDSGTGIIEVLVSLQ